MTSVGRFIIIEHGCGRSVGEQCLKNLRDVFVEMTLIAFQSQDVIGLFFDNALGDFFLASKRINRDDTIGQIERIDEFWNCRDLIRFLGNVQLTEHHAIGCRPRAHHMNRWLIEFGIIRVAKRFSINWYDFTAAEVTNGLHPPQKTGLKLCRLNPCENTTDGIVRWNTIGKGEKRFQPLVLFMPILFNIGRTICTTNDRTDGDGDNIEQEV